MKKINRISAILMAVLVFVGLAISAINTFAANKYNINYSGGTQLSTSNVKVDETLSGMTALYTGGSASYSSSSKWETVYKGTASNCNAYKMIRAWDSSRIGSSEDIYYMLSNSRYDVKIKINGITLEGFSSLSKNGDNVAVVAGAALYAGYNGTVGDALYSDSKCTQPEQGLVRPSPTAGQRIFVDTTITLYKHDTNQVFTSDNLYFGITDIDAAQSFKFMNPSITMAGNLYAMSSEALNTTGDYNPNNLKNMFVSSGNYIYSQYDTSTGAYMASPDIHNIYLKTSTTAQAEGLNIIFGFATNAGSSIRYYAQQYTVTYDSDSNGTISGKTSETVVSGNNPTGSSSTPNTGYEFKRWTANKNVTLTDGTTIAAGQPLTSAQVKKVVVNANIKFTAIHETMKLAVTYKSDDNGTITGKTNETVNYNNNPTGSESTPEPGFVFDHWVADKDVVLTNGDTIVAGNPITDEQVAQ
ncbi:InlB B-repeat-containing protein, partial [Candidatus Saccharibacteria bacterium]|nr:InlB B-repeat-containing protein [Candidatus Saccharibacteria bacterium]